MENRLLDSTRICLNSSCEEQRIMYDLEQLDRHRKSCCKRPLQDIKQDLEDEKVQKQLQAIQELRASLHVDETQIFIRSNKDVQIYISDVSSRVEIKLTIIQSFLVSDPNIIQRLQEDCSFLKRRGIIIQDLKNLADELRLKIKNLNRIMKQYTELLQLDNIRSNEKNPQQNRKIGIINNLSQKWLIVLLISVSLNILQYMGSSMTNDDKIDNVDKPEIQQHINDRINGQSKYVYPNGDIYEGQWKDNEMHGKGSIIYQSGDKYEGQWYNDRRNDSGSIIYSNGDKYEGQCNDNIRHGKGSIIYQNGNKYEGQWNNNHRHGKGSMIYQNGEKYEGQWDDNRRHGTGSMTYKNGEKYEGQWINNHRHGKGKNEWPKDIKD